MLRSRNAWWLYLALAAPVTAGYLAGPFHTGPVYNAIGFSAIPAIVVGVRMHRPSRTLGVVRARVRAGAVRWRRRARLQLPRRSSAVRCRHTSIADVFYLSCYPVTGRRAAAADQERNPGRDWASLIDAAIVTIGLALLSWVFLISPWRTTRRSRWERSSSRSPTRSSDILVLGVAVRLAVGAGRRSPAYYMMVGALVAVLAADSAYGWILLHGVYSLGNPARRGMDRCYVLFGAAALHPSMTTVSQPAEPEHEAHARADLAIAAAALIAPVVMVVKASRASVAPTPIVAGGAAIVLFALVIVRMIGLARDQDAAAERERTMRRAADALVTATSPAEIVRAAQDAAAMLAGAAARPTVLQIEERDGATMAGRTQTREAAATSSAWRLRRCPTSVVDQLDRRVAVELPDADARCSARASARRRCSRCRFWSQGQLAGAVALLDAAAASSPTRNSLETLAAQVGLALESAALTESMLRTQSEARLSALVQHSTDVILVIALGYDGRVCKPFDSPDARIRRRGLRRPNDSWTTSREEDQALFEPALVGAARARVGDLAGVRVSHPPPRRSPAAHRMPDHQPAGQRRRRRNRRQPARHHRAQAVRGAAHLPGVPRPGHRPREPGAVSRSRRARAQPPARRQPAARGAVPGPRRLQDGQRHLRPRRRRPAAADRLLAPAVRAACRRHRGAAGRRRVRGPARGRRERDRRLGGRRTPARGRSGAPLSLDDREVSVQCSIGIAVARSTSDTGAATHGRRAAAQRRRRDVPGEGRRRQHLPPLQARDAGGRRRAARAARGPQGGDRGARS